jgi:phospholipase/carboxylesterase
MTESQYPADLDALRFGPAKAERLAIVLHGVGDSAAGLAPLGEALAQTIPGLVSAVLNAPDTWDGGPPGRQWFSLTGITPANRPERVDPVIAPLWARIGAIAALEGVPISHVCVVGFSQGAMLTFALAASGRGFDRAVGLAGRLAAPVAPATPQSPRIFVGHGTHDPMVPFEDGRAAAEAMTAAGYDVSFQAFQGLGHGIDQRAFAAAQAFLAAPAAAGA